MLSSIEIKNFKQFETVKIELGQALLFVGPNNSGKTTVLQALSLWKHLVDRGIEKNRIVKNKAKQYGFSVSFRDISAIPASEANLFWRNTKTKKALNKNIVIELIVNGFLNNMKWQVAAQLVYANSHSFSCIFNTTTELEIENLTEYLINLKIAFLPPMSGLIINETVIDENAIYTRIGEGRTAEILRNLCFIVNKKERNPNNAPSENWVKIVATIKELFGIEFQNPAYEPRGDIQLSYRNIDGALLDISASGRGQLQTLLILAFMAANRDAVILLDEPDAHLEILRQRRIYNLVKEMAIEFNAQLFIASHSEILLEEAIESDQVVAFIGIPHTIPKDKKDAIHKSLRTFGFEEYLNAQQNGWVLYLEGSTDLSILRKFAKKVNHPVTQLLESPFVYYVGNQPSKAEEHFNAVKEASPNLVAIAIFDNIDKNLNSRPEFIQVKWSRCEIENYIVSAKTLLKFANYLGNRSQLPLFSQSFSQEMTLSIQKVIDFRISKNPKFNPYDKATKVTDDFLDDLFPIFYTQIQLRDEILSKANYFKLIDHMDILEIDSEVVDKLDAILNIANQASAIRTNNF